MWLNDFRRIRKVEAVCIDICHCSKYFAECFIRFENIAYLQAHIISFIGVAVVYDNAIDVEIDVNL